MLQSNDLQANTHIMAISSTIIMNIWQPILFTKTSVAITSQSDN
jgi:hypothetical protein